MSPVFLLSSPTYSQMSDCDTRAGGEEERQKQGSIRNGSCRVALKVVAEDNALEQMDRRGPFFGSEQFETQSFFRFYFYTSVIYIHYVVGRMGDRSLVVCATLTKTADHVHNL